MAGPVTHIVFAKKFLAQHPRLSEEEFIVGTSFPDIRYLGGISRDKTHVPLQLDQVLGSLDHKDPFTAGLIFHNYVDLARIDYWDKSGLLRTVPQSPYFSQTFKICEDIILYDEVRTWPEISSYFDTVLASEQAFAVEQNQITTWHKILQAYMRSRPSVTTVTELFTALRLDRDLIPPASEALRQLLERPDVKREVVAMYHALVELSS